MSGKPLAVNGRVWVEWVLANAMSMAIALALALPLLNAYGDLAKVIRDSLWRLLIDRAPTSFLVLDIFEMGGFALAGLVLGALMGGGQRIALRNVIRLPGSWVVGTAIGATVGFPFAFVLGITLLWGRAEVWVLLATLVAGVILGLSIGMVQWLFLRRKVPRAAVWPLASAAGMVLGFGVGGVITDVVVSIWGSVINTWFVQGGLAGAVYGLITGLVLFLFSWRSGGYETQVSQTF